MNKPPIIVGFDAAERTVTLRFDEPIIGKGFALGEPYLQPVNAEMLAALKRLVEADDGLSPELDDARAAIANAER